MRLTQQSIFTGAVNTLEIPLSKIEFSKAYKKWKAGTLIQDAFPTLNSAQREFIMTGASLSEQKKYLVFNYTL
jgi:hypothetical protein